MQSQVTDKGNNSSLQGFKSLYDSWEGASTEHQERERGVRILQGSREAVPSHMLEFGKCLASEADKKAKEYRTFLDTRAAQDDQDEWSREDRGCLEKAEGYKKKNGSYPWNDSNFPVKSKKNSKIYTAEEHGSAPAWVYILTSGVVLFIIPCLQDGFISGHATWYSLS